MERNHAIKSVGDKRFSYSCCFQSKHKFLVYPIERTQYVRTQKNKLVSFVRKSYPLVLVEHFKDRLKNIFNFDLTSTETHTFREEEQTLQAIYWTTICVWVCVFFVLFSFHFTHSVSSIGGKTTTAIWIVFLSFWFSLCTQLFLLCSL